MPLPNSRKDNRRWSVRRSSSGRGSQMSNGPIADWVSAPMREFAPGGAYEAELLLRGRCLNELRASDSMTSSKPLEQLIDKADPGWPRVAEWLRGAGARAEVLSADRS